MPVAYLSRRLDAFDERQKDDDPSQQQTQRQLPADTTKVMEAIALWLPEHVATTYNNEQQ